jgi:Flp pilus assembly protein TadB
MADGYIEKGHYLDDKEKIQTDIDRRVSVVGERGEIVNASGHRDQLQRHYGLLSICGLALTIDNAWVALGGSIAVSISAVFPNIACVPLLTPW